MIKRILLFALTNILILTTLTIIGNLFGLNHYMNAYGIDYPALMAFCLLWGMGGAFISLLMSRFMAKMFMGVKVIDPARGGQHMELVNTVHNIAKRANLPAMPEVGIYESDEVNAFATGPSKSRSLVAVSTGLLHRMNRDQVEGVLAHEVAHIQNGDMVTMTHLQGIVNAFVMFLARVLAFALSQNVKEESRGMVNFTATLVLQIGLSLLGMLVVMGFSRRREFEADAGAAKLVGANKMTAALEAIRRAVEIPVDHRAESLATLKINGGESKWVSLLSSHPPIEARIKALQMGVGAR